MGQKRLALLQDIQNRKRDDDMFVDLTINDIPVSLLREFGEKIIRSLIQVESARPSRT
jgi:hypothetical protein